VRELSERHGAFGVEGEKLLHQFRQRILFGRHVLTTHFFSLDPSRREEEGIVETPICRSVAQCSEPRGAGDLRRELTPRLHDPIATIHWDAGQYPPPVLQAIQSFTTGGKEVMISRPSSTKEFKVAGLAIPMRSLIEPVVVDGFGFIVIDDRGAVLFHSDPQHSLSENFFIETDNDRRLRALVAARRTEWLDIKYWGDDHRAFVSPLTRRPKSLDGES
jgi:hypothetical protein